MNFERLEAKTSKRADVFDCLSSRILSFFLLFLRAKTRCALFSIDSIKGKEVYFFTHSELSSLLTNNHGMRMNFLS